MGFLASTTDYRAQPNAPQNVADYQLALNQAINNRYNPDYNQANQTAGNQDQLAQMLMQQAKGQGPNLAQQQLNQATNQTMQSQAGAIASTKGINPALAARLASEQGTQQLQGAAGQSGMLQAQQQLGAQSQLGQALASQRGQDISQANTTANSEAQRLQTLGQLNHGQNQLAVQQSLGTQGINAGIEEANTAGRNQALGAGMKAWGDSSASFMGSMGGMMGGAAHGGVAGMDFKDGGHVPGEAEVGGDSPKNDTVHAMLSPGEIVLPRTIAGDGDKAKAFVEALQQHLGGKKKKSGYGNVIAAKRKAQDAA